MQYLPLKGSLSFLFSNNSHKLLCLNRFSSSFEENSILLFIAIFIPYI